MPTESSSYAALLRSPGVVRSFAPSIVGCLSLATSGLALILLLEQATGSFAVAGAITAVLGIANVAATPWRARLIDRLGQQWVLAVLGVAHGVSLLGFAFLPHGSMSALLALSVAAGASAPPFGATMRVLWAEAFPPGALRRRGFSLDAVAEEATFAVGPLVAAGVAAAVGPFAALVASAGCVTVGSALFVLSPLSRRQRGSRFAARPVASDDPAGLPSAGEVPPVPRKTDLPPLRAHGFIPLICVMTAPGLVLGAVEVAAPAIALDAGAPVMSGVLLAVFAGCSAVAGLAFGSLRLPGSRAAQLLALAAVLSACVVVVGMLGGIGAAAVGMAVGGACIAPMLILGYLSADSLTGSSVRTEAGSWINTAVNLGAACGAAVFGVLADAASPGAALAATGAAAALIAAVGGPLLVRRGGAE